jgi:cytochrome c-type biogenesis protein CcmH/NrfF
MEMLPYYLGGFGALVLLAIGAIYYQSVRTRKRLMLQIRDKLQHGAAAEQVEAELVESHGDAAVAAKLIAEALRRIKIEDAASRMEQGTTAEELRQELVSRGMEAEKAEEVVGAASFLRFCRQHPVVSMGLGVVLPLLGAVLVIGGILLWLGNKSGRFVTFPFSGHITIGLGLTILGLGCGFFVRAIRF